MRIYIVDNRKITKFMLPSNGDNFFSYNYSLGGGNNSALISFEKDPKTNKWSVKSNGVINVMNNNVSVGIQQLELYNCVQIKVIGYAGALNLFALPLENDLNFKLDNNNLGSITIGSDPKCNICYKHNMMAPVQVEIKKNGNSYTLTSIGDNNFATYVNNSRVAQTELHVGDIIFLYGLRIVWVNNFIIINNPNNSVAITGLNNYVENTNYDNTKYSPVSDEDQAVKLYNENDYFYHNPHITEKVVTNKVTIDPPPPLKEIDDMPWYLKAGSRLTMASGAFVMVWSLAEQLENGKPLASLTPRIVMLFAMVLGAMVAPSLIERFRNKKIKEYNKKRQVKYTEYLEEKSKEIDLEIKKNVQIMSDNYLSSSACSTIAQQPTNRNFWSREINDEYFLAVRMGLGQIPSPVLVDLPEKKFSLEQDELEDKLYEIKDKFAKVDNAPVVVNLLKNNITAFICNNQIYEPLEYFKNIIVQLAALHCASDLKIVIFTTEENEHKWEYAKFLPHCFSDDHKVRFFAATNEDTKFLSSYLEDEFKKRKNIVNTNGQDLDEDTKLEKNKEYEAFDDYYLIISDCYTNSNKIPIINDILKTKGTNYGFSFTIFTGSMRNIPSQCDTFIEIGAKEGAIIQKDISINNQQVFNTEIDNTIDMDKICKIMMNIPLVPKEGLNVLPTSLSFLEMYGVSRIEQLNILNRWQTNNPVNSLSAPIGVYANGDQFKLNLHEKEHGPHGLIAGSTGSGKSEFIISYILSMCVNYHPYEVQFVLIDYKGGGLAGAFENRETGVSIPHLAGTITNLDTASMNRTLVSIQSELKRRQRVFNETRDSLGESTIDIYKYQKLYREGVVKEPLPHLFIISDEFAELKQQQPDFMQELISTARIGRSLGVHLILATQKPSGVVNEQIWSNSKFKICLKVQDRSDSMEVLKKPDAASIKEAGRFYLQVGYDDFFDKGQSGWSGAKYVPSDRIIKKIDDSLEIINNTGDSIKSIKDLVIVENTKDYGDQLTNIVKYINNLGKKEKLVTKKLWLDPIPEEIYTNSLKEKYGFERKAYVIDPIIGEYDSPSTQTQHLLQLDLSKNTIICGSQGSGKENLITTIILSSILDHTPDEVNFYIIDCGSETLKIFQKIPHIGEVALQDDKEKIMGIFQMVSDEIDKRKELMADFGGSYAEYLNNSGEKLPQITVAINGYDSFAEGNMKIIDALIPLYRDGIRYGISFIISEIAPNGVKGRALQYFENALILKLQNESDYRTYFGTRKGLLPSNYFGRGIIIDEEGGHEFQTAFVVQKAEINNFVREITKVFSESYESRAKKIPIVPDIVYVDQLFEHVTTLDKVPVGYNIDTKDIQYYDFLQNQFNMVITTGMNDEKMSFLYALSRMFMKMPNTVVKVIDFAEAYEKDVFGVERFADNFDAAIINMNNEIITNKDSAVTTIYFFLGVGMYKKKLSQQGVEVLHTLFSKVSSITNVKFVIMDVLNSFKNVQVEEWFQTNVDNSDGIWLDKDAANQLIINAPNLTIEDRKLDFPCIAFTINNGYHEVIKFMVEDDIKGGNK
jgi:S-DNA-T family DNA segregation ATPase FtsK/SpoIIIE